jgi:hypothetical protein
VYEILISDPNYINTNICDTNIHTSYYIAPITCTCNSVKAIITFVIDEMLTYIALSNTAWNVGRIVSATEIPRIDNATRFNQIVLKMFKNQYINYSR